MGWWLTLAGLGCLLGAGSSSATTIVAPVSAVASSTFTSKAGKDFAIDNTIDQSGLSATYTSGLTDFDDYLAGNPMHTSFADGNEWFSGKQKKSKKGSAGISVTYDLGQAYSVDRMALWNEEFTGLGTTELYASLDGLTFILLATILPVDSPFAPEGTDIPYSAQVFSFLAAEFQYLKLVMLDCPKAPGQKARYCGIGEVAFSAQLAAAPVPVAPTLLLLVTALAPLPWLARRRKTRASA